MPQSISAAEAFRKNIQATHTLLQRCDTLAQPLHHATEMIRQALTAGRKILCCGNGGSAADAGHLAAEITGRYLINRPGFPAIDLTASPSLVTALINDFPPQEVFARQIQALGQEGDVLVVLTSSGNSENIRLALLMAKKKKLGTISFLGRDGGKCRGMADVEMIVPDDVTARIQEVHQLLYHTLCEILDPTLAQLAAMREG